MSAIAFLTANTAGQSQAFVATVTALASTVSQRLTSASLSAVSGNASIKNITQGQTVSSSGNTSIAFLAQVLSQNGDSSIDSKRVAASGFEHFSPAPHYNAFVGYSLVKYLPSDAGLPSGGSVAPETSSPIESTGLASAIQNYQRTASL